MVFNFPGLMAPSCDEECNSTTELIILCLATAGPLSELQVELSAVNEACCTAHVSARVVVIRVVVIHVRRA